MLVNTQVNSLVSFMTTELLLVTIVVVFAALVRGLTGFGLSMVAMPLLIELIGIEVAAPLVALISASAGIGILLRERQKLALRAVLPLVISSFVGIPLGVWALSQIDSRIVTGILGIVVAGYALYSLLAPEIPPLTHSLWAYILGFASGLLTGAYNTGGPPLVIYANAQRWESSEFRGNLQTMELGGVFLVVITHAVNGNLPPPVWTRFLLALPALALGLLAGFVLDKHIDPLLFRKIVLVMLLIIGLRLLII